MTTPPLGALRVELPEHGGDSTTHLLLNLTFQEREVHAGTLDAVSGSRLSDFQAAWQPGQFRVTDPVGVPGYCLELCSGDAEGLMIPVRDNTETDLILGEDAAYLLSGQQMPVDYKVRPLATLGELFSFDNSLYGLRSSGSPANADVVFLLNEAGVFEAYFYQEAPAFAGGTGWRKAGDSTTDYSGKFIPDNGLLLSRMGPDPGPAIQLIVSGEVRLGRRQISVFPGFNLIGHAYPMDTTLGECGLNPEDLISTGILDTSDGIHIANPTTGELEAYFYQTAPEFAGGSGWRIAGDAETDHGSKRIPAGTGLFIVRKRDPGFYWISESPF